VVIVPVEAFADSSRRLLRDTCNACIWLPTCRSVWQQ